MIQAAVVSRPKEGNVQTLDIDKCSEVQQVMLWHVRLSRYLGKVAWRLLLELGMCCLLGVAHDASSYLGRYEVRYSRYHAELSYHSSAL